MKRDERDYLLHVRDAITRILEYTQAGKQDFFARSIVRDAVVRNIEIIGEAVKNIPQSFKDKYPSVPWRKIARTRDKAIHQYFGLDWDLVWEIVENHIPELKRSIDEILTHFDQNKSKPA